MKRTVLLLGALLGALFAAGGVTVDTGTGTTEEVGSHTGNDVSTGDTTDDKHAENTAYKAGQETDQHSGLVVVKEYGTVYRRYRTGDDLGSDSFKSR